MVMVMHLPPFFEKKDKAASFIEALPATNGRGL